MKSLLRPLVAILLALWIALPGIGGEGEGGENAGGTGVWILPRCTFLTSGSQTGAGPGCVPRLSISLGDLTRNVELAGSNELGQAVATLVDTTSCMPVALPVTGRNITIPAATLQGMLSAGVPDADIVVLDGAQRGYRIRLQIDLVARSALVLVF